jgi:hypothetical protein
VGTSLHVHALVTCPTHAILPRLLSMLDTLACSGLLRQGSIAQSFHGASEICGTQTGALKRPAESTAARKLIV